MLTYDRFDNKKILIWGFGREGRSTKEFLDRYCRPLLVDVFEGKREDMKEEDYDYIIKSPGIVLDTYDPRFTSQTRIFLECYRKNTIGVTGTKGKSTTSSMLYHTLSATGHKTLLVGNIGEPCLNSFGDIDDDTVVVFEMSCHQLAHLDISPHIAVFLNLFEEHLDYYKTVDRYFAAKANITAHQGEDDFFFVGDNVPHLETRAHTTVIDRSDIPAYDLKVLGHHNDYNAHFVYKICSSVFGIDEDAIRGALSDFTGLPHRLEHIGTIEGVDYYDDSISTIPSATIQALTSVPNAATVLIGGMDRGINYDLLIDYINSHREYNYIFSYASGKRIYDSVEKSDNCRYAGDLAEAVKLAKAITAPGFAVILSPASASYGYFKNFEERGDVFRELCNE